MDTKDTSPYATAGIGSRVDARVDVPPDPYELTPGDPGPLVSRPLSRRFPASLRSRGALSAGLPANPADAATPPQTLGQPAPHTGGRKHRTWPQRVGGVLIACICVVSAVWYVPRVVSDDKRLLTGTVTHTGVITLNFASSGQIDKMKVHVGQTVHKGEVLATEYAPSTAAVIAAEKAAIASDKARIAQLRAAEVAYPAGATVDSAQIAATSAQLASDQAQLASARAKFVSTEIIAPSSGTVVAANGQSGEVATASGIRDYATDSPQPSAVQRPAFSLFPQPPAPARRTTTSGSALPVIALRTSTSWQVVVLVPEGSISRIAHGPDVTISVPAAHIANVQGKIDEVLPTPVSTSQGIVYQALVAINGHPNNVPLNGMTADIHLAR